MTIVTLIGFYLVLTIMPHLMLEITGHQVTVDLSYPMDRNVMKWITHKAFDIKIQNGNKTFDNSTIW